MWGYAAPKYSLEPLAEAVHRRLGDVRLADAVREVIVASYDMTNREPFFFKRWRAREPVDPSGPAAATRNHPIVDAAMATSAAPTYFPSHELGRPRPRRRRRLRQQPVGRGDHRGAEAQRRGRARRDRRPPRRLDRDRRPRGGLRPAHGQWLGEGRMDPSARRRATDPRRGPRRRLRRRRPLGPHAPQPRSGSTAPARAEIGRGPRYFRLQIRLDEAIPLDDAREQVLTDALPAAAAALIADHERGARRDRRPADRRRPARSRPLRSAAGDMIATHGAAAPR